MYEKEWKIDVRPAALSKEDDWDYSTDNIDVNYEVTRFEIFLNDELIGHSVTLDGARKTVEVIKSVIEKFGVDEESVSCECNSEYLITEYTLESENSDPEVYQYACDAEMMGTAVAEAIERGFKIVSRDDLAEECNLSLYFVEDEKYPIGCVVVVKIS